MVKGTLETSPSPFTQRTPWVKVKALSNRFPQVLPNQYGHHLALMIMDRHVFISLASALSKPTCTDVMYWR